MNRYDVTLYDPLDETEVVHINVKAETEAKAIRTALHRMTFMNIWHVRRTEQRTSSVTFKVTHHTQPHESHAQHLKGTSMATKTAVVHRAHVYGTHRHVLHVTYRGRTLRWREASSPSISCHASFQHTGQESEEHARSIARKFKFTHVRFEGDWTRHTKPKGGKL